MYDELNDNYICLNGKDLTPNDRYNKDKYKIYKIYKVDKCDYSRCLFKEQCTKFIYKQILKHVWEEYKEMANDYRHHQNIREIYKQRPQHTERVFTDEKIKYISTKIYFRSREKFIESILHLYECTNSKKFALKHYT